jgi:hypothetical protein
MIWSTIVQIYKKFGAREEFVPRVPNMAMHPGFQTAVSAVFCLTLSQIGKDITPWILGVHLCKSIRS